MHTSRNLSSIDGRERGGALAGDRPKPWWEDNPELEEIRRRTLEEFAPEPEEREPIEPDAPDPVPTDFLGGASWRELADARDDLTRARARYEQAVQTARAAGLS
jgi:hypothetical protein